MTFDQAYRKLEEEFRQRVEDDNKGGKFESILLPNVGPAGPVDYVLVGMEPSLGGWAKDVSVVHPFYGGVTGPDRASLSLVLYSRIID